MSACSYHPDDEMTFLFRELTPEEEKGFADYARENNPPDMAKWEIYHPACRKVWRERGIKP